MRRTLGFGICFFLLSTVACGDHEDAPAKVPKDAGDEMNGRLKA